MKLKAIIFDSSVLINVPKMKLREATNKIISYYTEPESFMKQYEKGFKKMQQGKIKEEEFFKKILKELPSRSVKRIKEQHDKKRDELVSLRKDVKSVLTALSKQYKLGLISNMPKCWFDHDTKRLGLNTELFNTMTFSCNEGILKPAEALYKKTCKELKEKPDRCAYITNHDYEIIGATNNGMTVITINQDGGDMRIEQLNELVELFSETSTPGKNIHEVNSP